MNCYQNFSIYSYFFLRLRIREIKVIWFLYVTRTSQFSTAYIVIWPQPHNRLPTVDQDHVYIQHIKLLLIEELVQLLNYADHNKREALTLSSRL